MRPRSETEIDRLAAPAEDGALLLWPPPQSWAALVEANRRARQTCVIAFANRRLGKLLEGQFSGPPVVMSGHQPGFIHPGIWVKNVAASGLAARLGGQAKFLVVDSDAPRQLVLCWPRRREDAENTANLDRPEGRTGASYGEPGQPSLAAGGSSSSPLAGSSSFSPRSASDWLITESAAIPGGIIGLAYEQFKPLAAPPWREFFGCVRGDCADSATQTWPVFVEGFLGGGATASYVDRWIAGVMAVDRLLGVHSPQFVRASSLFSNSAAGEPGGEAASHFVAHLLLNADSFAGAYNAALAEYRRRRGIRGRQHPVPDLVQENRRTEIPFWVFRDSRPRCRLFISHRGADKLELWAGDVSLCVLGAPALAGEPGKVLGAGLKSHWIRPRALALTMYARLLACDLFIHGIGGAKYDQIADDVIRRFFRVEPPAYACVSATCRLPLPRFNIAEGDRAAAARAFRDLRYNPQRRAGDSLLKNNAEAASVLARRASAVAEAARLREQASWRHAERRAAFKAIREANEGLQAAMPGAIEAARRRLAEVEACLEHDRIAKSREWFLALYPGEQLRRLGEDTAAAVSAGSSR